MFITKTNSAFVDNCAVGLSELARSVNVGIAALKVQELDDPEKGLWTEEAFDAPDTHRLFGEDRGDRLATQLQHLVFPQGKACNDKKQLSSSLAPSRKKPHAADTDKEAPTSVVPEYVPAVVALPDLCFPSAWAASVVPAVLPVGSQVSVSPDGHCLPYCLIAACNTAAWLALDGDDEASFATEVSNKPMSMKFETCKPQSPVSCLSLRCL